MRKLVALFTLGSCAACQSAPKDGIPPSTTGSAQTSSATTAGVAEGSLAGHTAQANSSTGSSAAAAASTVNLQQPATGASLNPDIAPDFGDAGPVSIEPKIPAFVTAMMDHSHAFGWTADSAQFGYCVTSGGSGSTRCRYLLSNGKLEEATDQGADDQPDPKKTPALNARIARHTQREARWAYARDLVISWQAINQGDDATASARPELHVGARVRGSKSSALPIKIRADANYYTTHPEAVSVSPNGRRLVVLSHAFAGEYSDAFELRSIGIDELAAQAYNNAGLDLHRQGKYQDAASLFHRAAYADSTSKLPSYNLACALARLEADSAQQALRLAIARGGVEVKTKAAKDADFDKVRTQSWFVELTKP